ncbi:MAG: HD family hydrolase [Alphaproteobacteria bacterium]|nr:HD family hydrolase [Alphaproteobacteria bacterium]
MTNRNFRSPSRLPSAAAGAATPRAWQRMLSGRRLDLLDPAPADIEIEDIAHGLARVARWNGQTLGDHALSVAQHVLVVEAIAAERNPDWELSWKLAALLHDAAEYVVGDLISPFKNAIGLNYKSFEIRLLEAIHKRFGLPPALPDPVAAEIKRADRIAAFYEATVLAGFSSTEALEFFGEPDGIGSALQFELRNLAPLPASDAQKRFILRFESLAS